VAAGDLTAVVDAVGAAEAPVVVGHSLGAIVAIAYVAGGGGARAVVSVDQGLRLADFAALVRPLEAELRGPNFRDVYPVVLHALGFDRLDPDTQERLRAIHDRASQDVVLGVWGPLFESTDEQIDAVVDGLLAEVRVPYLSLHGSDLGPDYARWLTARMPTATVEVWDGAGHWLHLVDPDRFVSRVSSFVAET
jgi:pimeloyl-ACP methyl ester carboxylesterase